MPCDAKHCRSNAPIAVVYEMQSANSTRTVRREACERCWARFADDRGELFDRLGLDAGEPLSAPEREPSCGIGEACPVCHPEKDGPGSK